jgi:hypothetical protein
VAGGMLARGMPLLPALFRLQPDEGMRMKSCLLKGLRIDADRLESQQLAPRTRTSQSVTWHHHEQIRLHLLHQLHRRQRQRTKALKAMQVYKDSGAPLRTTCHLSFLLELA